MMGSYVIEPISMLAGICLLAAIAQRAAWRVRLPAIGALITWILTSVIVHYVVGFNYDLALLFGAMVVVTGPTVSVPMLRTVRPVRRVANILHWEAN